MVEHRLGRMSFTFRGGFLSLSSTWLSLPPLMHRDMHEDEEEEFGGCCRVVFGGFFGTLHFGPLLPLLLPPPPQMPTKTRDAE